MTTARLEFSATYVGALRDSLAKLRHLAAVESRVTPAAARMLDAPASQPWWPEELLLDLMHVLRELLGDDGVKAIAFDASHSRMGPISRPLINVLLLVSGATPDTLLSRISLFVSLGVRPVKSRWVRSGPTSGEVSFEFSHDVPTDFGLLWWGLLEETFALARSGRVTGHELGPAAHRFTIDWG